MGNEFAPRVPPAVVGGVGLAAHRGARRGELRRRPRGILDVDDGDGVAPAAEQRREAQLGEAEKGEEREVPGAVDAGQAEHHGAVRERGPADEGLPLRLGAPVDGDGSRGGVERSRRAVGARPVRCDAGHVDEARQAGRLPLNGAKQVPRTLGIHCLELAHRPCLHQSRGMDDSVDAARGRTQGRSVGEVAFDGFEWNAFQETAAAGGSE